MQNHFQQYLKRLLSIILINNFSGRLLSKLKRDKLKCYSLIIDTSNPIITPKIKASIFFNKYESAEYRFISKYLKRNNDVIELGASIGIISCVIRKIISDEKRLISIEANSTLHSIIQNNININGLDNNFHLICKAINYIKNSTESIMFLHASDNLTGKIIKNLNIGLISNNIIIESLSLSQVINDYKINEYILVSDIEGSEVGILLNDKESLVNCKQIIIETHDTIYNNTVYSYQEIADLIQSNHNFKLIDSYGPVYVFEK